MFICQVKSIIMNKDIALSLINAVFELAEEEQITDIEFIDRTIFPEYMDSKLSRLDILGRTEDGSKIGIEMQVANEYNMAKRALYYWAKIYTDLGKGEDYKELKRTVSINILKYNMLECSNYHSNYGIYNIANGDRLTKDLEIY